MSDELDGLELVPADDAAAPTPDEAIDAAAASSLEDPEAPIAVPDDPPDPLGYSWLFDFDQGRFFRQGGAPALVTGLDALKQRCMMALYSARFAHAVLSDEFGIEAPLLGIGLAGEEALLAADDWKRNARDALMAVDSVVDVQLSTEYDPVEGAIYLTDLVVTTNEDVELRFDDIAINVGEDD